MKKLIPLFLVIIFPVWLNAQTHMTTVGIDSKNEAFFDVKIDPNDNGTVYVGDIFHSITDSDCYIVKLNSTGQQVWQKTIINPGRQDAFYSISICGNGDYIAVGQYEINDKIWGFVCRINSTTGDLIWSEISSNAPWGFGDRFFGVLETNNNNIIIAGTNNWASGGDDGFIVSLNAAGVQNWAKTLDVPFGLRIQDIAQFSNGNLLVAGSTFNASSSSSILIVEIDEANGNIIAQNAYGINIPNPNPSGGNILKRFTMGKLYVINNTGYLQMSATDDSFGANNGQGIFTYNQASHLLEGNLFWHNGSPRVSYQAFYPIAPNDYVIAQSVDNNTSFSHISRYSNGTFVYDKELLYNNTFLFAMEVRGNDLIITGSDPFISEGFGLRTTIDFPSLPAPCNIPDVTTAQAFSYTPTSEVTNFSMTAAGNVMVFVPLITVNYSGIVANACICTPPIPSLTDISICEGESVTIDAFTPGATTYNWTSSPPGFTSVISTPTITPPVTTVYHVNVGNGNCSSDNDITVTVRPKSLTTINQTICEGQDYQGYTTTGTYINTLLAANGCDSIITLNLTVNPKSFTTVDYSICEGQSYEGHTTTGTYINTLIAANGCDSVVTLNLTVNVPVYSTINQSICEGQTYEGYGVTGSYTNTFMGSNGCDSIRTLNLIVRPKSYSTISDTICEGQFSGGHGTTGTFVDIFIAANGCDSVRTLNLIVKLKSYSTINETICQGYAYLGYTTTGTYSDILTASNGCDSIRTLNLTVMPHPVTEITKQICRGQVYDGYNSSGNYIDTLVTINGCDSIRILHLQVEYPLNPSLGPDLFLCTGDSINLYPGVFDNYLWQDGSTAGYYIASSAGLYSVTVNNSCGPVKDEVIITTGECSINFPNTFTPNNDGTNDIFHILHAVNLKDYYLRIYNRWGEKVFETNDCAKGWNGTYKGLPCNTGVYLWYAGFKPVNRPHRQLKGTLILLR